MPPPTGTARYTCSGRSSTTTTIRTGPEHDFAWLLHQVHDVDRVERIRFASPHPRHVTPRLIEALRDLPKVCKHLHLPVQSGSSRVLQRMRRRYSREVYLQLVAEVRDAIPNIALSTDMIVGFPGEDPDDFEDTLSLTEAVQFHGMFSFKYSQRPNTLAAKRMPDTVPEGEKTERLMTLQALQRRIQVALNTERIGDDVEVLVDAHSRRRPQDLSGRTTQNTVVNFRAGPTGSAGRSPCTWTAPGPHSLRGTAICAA